MLKKRAVILGLIGVMTAGFGFAGCAETGSTIGSEETTTIVDTLTVETDITEEGGIAIAKDGEADETSSADYGNGTSEDVLGTKESSEQNAPKTDSAGMYHYEILNGKATIPLSINIDDYLVYGSDDVSIERPDDDFDDVLHYDFEGVASHFGWEPWGRFKEQNYGKRCRYFAITIADGTELRCSMGQEFHAEQGAAGRPVIYSVRIEPENDRTLFTGFKQVNYENSIYLSYDEESSFTYDQIIISAYFLEQGSKMDYYYDVLEWLEEEGAVEKVQALRNDYKEKF